MYDHGLTNKRFGANLNRFGTLEHTVGETLVILYVHLLIFLRFFLSLLKFSLILINMKMRQFSNRITG